MFLFLYKLTDFITFLRHVEKLYFGMSPNHMERHINFGRNLIWRCTKNILILVGT